MPITDTNNNLLTYLPLTIDSGQTSQVIVVRVDCVAGTWLASNTADDAQVLVRRTGSGDAFIDIAAAPINLSAFDGQSVDFDLKVTAGNVSGIARLAIPVRVTHQP